MLSTTLMCGSVRKLKRFICDSSCLRYTKTSMHDQSVWNKARFSHKVTPIHKWFRCIRFSEPEIYNRYDTLIRGLPRATKYHKSSYRPSFPFRDIRSLFKLTEHCATHWEGRRKLKIKYNSLQASLYLIRNSIVSCMSRRSKRRLLVSLTVTHYVPELPLNKMNLSYDFFFRHKFPWRKCGWGWSMSCRDGKRCFSMRGLKVKGPFEFFSTSISVAFTWASLQ